LLSALRRSDPAEVSSARERATIGTVEIEKQHANRQKQHEQRMNELREDSEKYSAIAQQTKKENERLAELESKIEELFYKHGINSNPTEPTDKP
jgi:flagellar motility protein MotE (MotC chaperone)